MLAKDSSDVTSSVLMKRAQVRQPKTLQDGLIDSDALEPSTKGVLLIGTVLLSVKADVDQPRVHLVERSETALLKHHHFLHRI